MSFKGHMCILTSLGYIKLELHWNISRNSHQRCSIKKGVLRNFAKFTRKNLRQSVFVNKVTGLRSATLLTKRLWHRCFLVNFAQFLRPPFLHTEHVWWLFLYLLKVNPLSDNDNELECTTLPIH